MFCYASWKIGNKVWIPISTTLAPRDPRHPAQSLTIVLKFIVGIHKHPPYKSRRHQAREQQERGVGSSVVTPRCIPPPTLPMSPTVYCAKRKITGQAWGTRSQKKKWKGNWNSLMHDSCIQLIPTISEGQFEVSHCRIFFLSFFLV